MTSTPQSALPFRWVDAALGSLTLTAGSVADLGWVGANVPGLPGPLTRWTLATGAAAIYKTRD